MAKPTKSDPLLLQDWITPQEAAELIGVTAHQVRHLARTDVLESQRFGRAWMIKRVSAEAYATQEHRPGPKPKDASTV